ncbi:MAG TPA: M1 family aminopeptidase, partial [Acidimicrobiales bacterium]|nr:M1 family aminopeptidase [Acidimicrobiales bacterium]
PGKGPLTAYALEVAQHALEFFTDWFGIEYPAEKLDLLAIPDFAFGAMENLGCVTFREALLLVDPARASRVELERVADVIAHEIAHMWFGDLVTMKWWNGIWLNEAFATLMELLCVDAFRPDWQRWVTFGLERDVAMATDSLHSTRPVEYPVGPPEEAQGMFDVLTYQKGAGVLRMLERFLGAEAFRDGVRRYLDTHRLGNTETADLWAAIEQSSDQPVRRIMDTWLLQGGFPLVTVHEADGDLVASQEPFSYAPGATGSAIGADWSVPLIARAVGTVGEHRVLLGTEPAPLAVGDRSAPVVLNAHGSGYYRVRYAPEHLRTLAGDLQGLEVLERFNLLGDTWAVVVAGRAPLDEFLVLAEALGGEDDPDVWAQVTGALSFLDHAVTDEQRPILAALDRALLSPVLDRLGWDATDQEGPRTATLRAQVIGSLGTVGQDDTVRAEARRRYAAAAAGAASIAPDLFASVLAALAAGGGPTDFDDFLAHYRKPATPQEEMRYLYALAGFTQPLLAARAFELARSEVRTQNAPFLIHMLLSGRENGPATWMRVRDHWDDMVARLPSNILPRMLDGLKLQCRDAAAAAEIRSFVDAHPLPIGARTVEQVLERLDVNVTFAGALAAEATPVLEGALRRLEAR